jgi:lipoate-protein ligase A
VFSFGAAHQLMMTSPVKLVGNAHPTIGRLIFDEPALGACNMAVDESLLVDAAESGVTTLRFYRWSEPTLSLGYFQRYEDRQQHAASRKCAVVRRQTGGGAILHDREITYSLVLPAGHLLARHSDSLYAAVHDAFIAALADSFRDADEPLTFHRRGEVSNAQPRTEPFLCFERRAMGDVLVDAARRTLPIDLDSSFSDGHQWKILGSAQRRSRGALLQHGSLLLERSPAAPELPGLLDLTGCVVGVVQLKRLVDQLQEALDVEFLSTPVPPEVESQAREIANRKYENMAWTKRR